MNSGLQLFIFRIRTPTGMRPNILKTFKESQLHNLYHLNVQNQKPHFFISFYFFIHFNCNYVQINTLIYIMKLFMYIHSHMAAFGA